jgi:uncharacterized protein
MKGQNVIDSDGHVVEFTFSKDEQGNYVEGPTIWNQYLEKKYRDRGPRIIVDNWGHHQFLIEGRVMAANPPDWCKAFDVYDHVLRPGGYDPHERLKDMDQEGIDKAVLYPSIFLMLDLVQTEVPFSVALCRAYNNWLGDYCKADPRRLKGIAVVPLVSIEEACKELRRAVKELGFVGMKIPPIVFHKMLDHSDFYPLYAELQDLDVAMGVHHHAMMGSEIPAAQYDTRFPLIQAACFPHDNMLACGALIYGGVLDRFPQLRVAFLESGCSWVSFWMRRLEQHSEFAKIGYDFPMKKTVIEHMTGEQCYYHVESEEVVMPIVLKDVGEERFMYASDYPHYGDAITAFGAVAKWEQSEGIREATKRKILGENAARLYRLNS